MSVTDYYRILGLHSGCSVDEIKKAYRNKAREFHPDLNHSAEAKDLFISATEAYEFLLTYSERMKVDEEAYNKAMEHWKKYRQAKARQKARVYAQTSFIRFKNTNFYKTTRIFDITTIAFSMVISIMVLVISVYGYIYRIHHPIPGIENPSVSILVLFILLGMILFIYSVIHLKIYIQTTRQHPNSL